MFRCTLLLASVLGVTLSLHAQEETAPLTKEQILSAANSEEISLPMPGELFAALEKTGHPDWNVFVRKAPAANFTIRAQIALNLGGLVADGYLAVEAKDAQQVKNVARDIKALSAKLGVQQDLINRGNSIVDFATNGLWGPLQEELESVQNEVIAAMKAQNDDALVTLVSLGGWLRGTEIVTRYISKNYSEAAARSLRQPAVADYFVQQLAKLADDKAAKKTLDNPVVTSVRLTLFEIRKALTFASETTPTVEEVTKLNELTATLLKTITTRE